MFLCVGGIGIMAPFDPGTPWVGMPCDFDVLHWRGVGSNELMLLWRPRHLSIDVYS